jgi:hypothetical protein
MICNRDIIVIGFSLSAYEIIMFIFQYWDYPTHLYNSPIYADKELLSKATEEQKQWYAKEMYKILDEGYDTNILWRLRILTFTFKQLVECQNKSTTDQL